MIDLESIPTNPGCYLFKDNKGNILYVGKAKNLKKRVKSYFQKKDHDPKTEILVNNIDSIDFIATETPVEALILENNLIKKYSPKYNIDLKDSKRYAYILITHEDYPRLLIARKAKGPGKFYGPFVSGSERDYVLEVLKKTFKVRTCKRIPKKACLRYHINLCNAPCIGNESLVDYNKKIDDVREVLKGKISDLIKEKEKEMNELSKKQHFEKALLVRNQINAMSYLKEKQNMQRQRKYNEDIIGYKIHEGMVYLMLFKIYKGTLEEKSEFIFDYNPNFIEEFIVQYYSESDTPKEVILPINIDSSINQFLDKKKKSKVRIVVPKIGEKKDLLKLVEKNIELTFFGNIKRLRELKDKLKLNDMPYVIECFDISHISGKFTVGSMVQFRNGIPDKTNYRRFKIKTVSGIDDFRSISEVVRRRYTRLIKEGSVLPNLIIIDGGKGQLSSAINELGGLNLKIPTISIAKKFEEIFVPGLNFPINLDRKEKALQFIQAIRDEAHRFAIKYNRLLRKKELIR